MRDRWTTPDFDGLSWHDCHVHGLRLTTVQEENGTADLELDLDFIVEWLPRGDGTIQFLVAPATLTFHEMFGLRIEIDYVTPTAGMTPFSLDGIEREEVTYETGHRSFRWRLPINWPAGQITFEGPAFTQVLRREPFLVDRQSLLPAERDAHSGSVWP
jgi:hypothetical protein